jgi:hypothetical protein
MKVLLDNRLHLYSTQRAKRIGLSERPCWLANIARASSLKVHFELWN